MNGYHRVAFVAAKPWNARGCEPHSLWSVAVWAGDAVAGLLILGRVEALTPSGVDKIISKPINQWILTFSCRTLMIYGGVIRDLPPKMDRCRYLCCVPAYPHSHALPNVAVLSFSRCRSSSQWNTSDQDNPLRSPSPLILSPTP
jgi:hypothetical protein